jgi:hypothetical protein
MPRWRTVHVVNALWLAWRLRGHQRLNDVILFSHTLFSFGALGMKIFAGCLGRLTGGRRIGSGGFAEVMSEGDGFSVASSLNGRLLPVVSVTFESPFFTTGTPCGASGRRGSNAWAIGGGGTR